MQAEKVTRCHGFWAGRVIGSDFFDNNVGHVNIVNGEHYRLLIINWPELDDLDTGGMFQRNGNTYNSFHSEYLSGANLWHCYLTWRWCSLVTGIFRCSRRGMWMSYKQFSKLKNSLIYAPQSWLCFTHSGINMSIKEVKNFSDILYTLSLVKFNEINAFYCSFWIECLWRVFENKVCSVECNKKL